MTPIEAASRDLGDRGEGLLAAAGVPASRDRAQDHRYRSRRSGDERLRRRLRELAAERRRFGYRRLLTLLRREGIVANHKRAYRIYTEERLTVRKLGGRKRALGSRAPMTVPQAPNQRLSLDFVCDALDDGPRFRVPVVVDDFSRECLPQRHGADLACHSRLAGEPARGLALHRAGQVHAERLRALSLIGRFWDECLNEHVFRSLPAARRTIELWRADDNTERPHTSLGAETLADAVTFRSTKKPRRPQVSETQRTIYQALTVRLTNIPRQRRQAVGTTWLGELIRRSLGPTCRLA